jgi:hypothetical protein
MLGAPASAREHALELCARDVEAYGAVLAGEPGALAAAADPPLAIAELAAGVAERAAELAGTAKESMRGDAVAAAMLAEAASAAAAQLVAVDLADRPDDPRVGLARVHADRAARARDAALSSG